MRTIRRLRSSLACLVQLAVVANLFLATFCCVPQRVTLAGDGTLSLELCTAERSDGAQKSGSGHTGASIHSHCFICASHPERIAPLLEVAPIAFAVADRGGQPPLDRGATALPHPSYGANRTRAPPSTV